jgi:cytochrome P450
VLQIRDQLIKAGQGVICLNQSANRDTDVFQGPDSFDIHRDVPIQHVAFGYGPHVCIAECLARLELEVSADVWPLLAGNMQQ